MHSNGRQHHHLQFRVMLVSRHATLAYQLQTALAVTQTQGVRTMMCGTEGLNRVHTFWQMAPQVFSMSCPARCHTWEMTQPMRSSAYLHHTHKTHVMHDNRCPFSPNL